MLKLQWVGAILDSSGYAEASRNYILSLLDRPKDIQLSLKAISFEQQKASHDAFEAKAKKFYNRPIDDCRLQVIHATPENYRRLRDPSKYAIGYTTWEATSIPEQWVQYCNEMDEIWVPSTWNVGVFKDSGVKVPIHVVPHVIQLPPVKNVPYLDLGPERDLFFFYSIFQWVQRKRPLELLKAYLTEFKPEENVCLVFKSYRLGTRADQKEIIKKSVRGLKDSMRLPIYPRLRFLGDLMTTEQIYALHEQCHCFVLPTAAEGFGIPLAEAMLHGKPTISTNYSGHLDFMNRDNSLLVNYQMTPISGMLFPNYTGAMCWADPDVMDLRAKMRWVYERRNEAAKIAQKGKETIQVLHNPQKVSQIILNRLVEIQKGLK